MAGKREEQMKEITERLEQGANIAEFSVKKEDAAMLPVKEKEDTTEFSVKKEDVAELPVMKKENAAEHPAAKKENAALPVYKYPLSHALEHGEKSVYQLSRKENIACRNAIEQAIRENFDGMYLNRDAVKQVLAQFGAERVAYVLAYTVYEKDWDGRFSRDNKAWAKNTSFCEDKDGCGDERKTAFVVQSHPAVLNMFVDFARKEMLVLPNKKQSVLQALRERQARMKAQEKEGQGQRAPAHSKRGQEL